MRISRFPIATGLFALALVACQKTAQTNDMTNTAAVNDTMAAEPNGAVPAAGAVDAAFLTDAIKGDNGEVAIGKLAQAQGQSQAVKDFGKMLETDHGAHEVKLAALASSNGVAVPNGPSEDGQKNLDKLKALHGAEFDKAFKTAMIEDHQKDIAKYEKQAAGTDAQTAAIAKDTLPTLHKHLDTANAL